MSFKRVAAIGLAVVLALALTGCIEVRQHLTINNDGSGQIVQYFLMDESLVGMGGETESPFGEFEQGLTAEGYLVEEYTEGSMTGFKATKELDDVTKVELIFEGAAGEISVDKGLFENTYVVDVVLPVDEEFAGTTTGEEPAPETSEETTGDELDLGFDDPAMLADIVEAKVIITMPGTISESNASSLSDDGKTGEWNVSLTEETPIKATSKAMNSLTLIVLGACVGFGLLVVVIVIVMMARKRKTAAVPAAAPTMPSPAVVPQAPLAAPVPQAPGAAEPEAAGESTQE